MSKYCYEDYKRLHNLIWKYKDDNNEESLFKVLELLKSFTNRYIDLIFNMNFDYNDKVIVKFIFLFMPHIKNKTFYIPSVINELDNTVEKLSTILSSYGIDEINNIIIDIILIMISKYHDVRPSFHTYLLRTFNFYLMKYLSRNYINDLKYEISLVYNSGLFIYNNLELYFLNKSIYNEFGLKPYINYNFMDDSFIDTNWICGYTCSDLFTCLTTFEREILVLYLIDKYSISKIKDTSMFGQDKIRETIVNIKKILKENYKQEEFFQQTNCL